MSARTDALLQRVATAAFRLAGALPERAQRALAGRPTRIDGQVLHPEIQVVLRMLNRLPGADFETLPLAESRAQVDLESEVFGGEPIPMATVEERVLPGGIPARLYRPHGLEQPSGLVVYFHGGGFVVGSLDSCDSVCRFLAAHADVAVLSIGYRLAPEHRFPAAVDDAVAAYGWAAANAAELGVDPQRIAVAGDSAGGNLAAVVAQAATPAFQLLFFPWTDLSTKSRSYQLFPTGFFLTDAQIDWYRDHYLPDAAAALDPRASPLLAADLSGGAPAYVAVAGFDVLRDEGIAYAERLHAAGVPTTLRVHRDLIHAFVNTTGVGRTGRAAMLEAAAALRVGLSFAGTSR